MSETAVATPTAGGGFGQFAAYAIPNRANLTALSKRTDLFFATAVMGILTVLIFPLPAFLLDLLLAVSIIISVLIMMTGLFIDNPLEFTVFRPCSSWPRCCASPSTSPPPASSSATGTKARPPLATSSRRSATS